MSEAGTGAGAPYTEATRARVLMAYEACELADLARAAVPIGAHELRPDGTVHAPGTALADAARVLTAARRFFDAAVVYERTGGASWQLVGEILGVPGRAARVRFAMAEARFREELLSPDVSRISPDGPAAPGGTDWWRAYMAREPLEAARDLDDWVLRHADGDEGLGAAPVSGGLARGDGCTHP